MEATNRCLWLGRLPFPPAEVAGVSSENVLFDKYKLRKLLGCGTFSKLSHARDTKTGQNVAIKVISKKKITGTSLLSKVKHKIFITRRLHSSSRQVNRLHRQPARDFQRLHARPPTTFPVLEKSFTLSRAAPSSSACSLNLKMKTPHLRLLQLGRAPRLLFSPASSNAATLTTKKSRSFFHYAPSKTQQLCGVHWKCSPSVKAGYLHR